MYTGNSLRVFDLTKLVLRTAQCIPNFLQNVPTPLPRYWPPISLRMHLQVAYARGQLQSALELSHPAQTARYLTVAAAACLNHGLQQSQSASGPRLILLPVTYAQVAEHVKAKCPDVSNLLLKLQGKTGSKYFTTRRTSVAEPLMVAVSLCFMITPPQKPHVAHILSDMQCKSLAPLAEGSMPELGQLDAVKSASSISPSPLGSADSTDSIPQPVRPNSASAVLTVRQPVPAAASHRDASNDVSLHCSCMLVSALPVLILPCVMWLHSFDRCAQRNSSIHKLSWLCWC